MLKQLKEIIKDLPKFLENPEEWQSLVINRRKPITWRAFRMIGENRLCLHKFEKFDETADEAFIHTHPWPAAFLLTAGGYRMDVGKVDSPTAHGGTTVATFEIWAGCAYEMIQPLGMHRVTPLTPEVFTIMLNGPAWPPGMVHEGVKTTKGKDLDSMTPEQLQAHLKYFKLWWRYDSGFGQAPFIQDSSIRVLPPPAEKLIDKKECMHTETYYSMEMGNYYCSRCKSGMGNEYYLAKTGRSPLPR
mgnify:CR=1 FL=1